MTLIKVGGSKKNNTVQAYNEVKKNLDSSSKLIMFFASTIYDYGQLVELFTKDYPNTQVVGLTTVGEIHNEGIAEQSLVAVSFAGNDVKVAPVLMENIHKYPIFQRDELIQAAKSINLNINSTAPEHEGVAFVFPNGLINAEERMLSIVNSIFKYEGFQVFGGTAGDDAKFVKTYTSLNDQISSTAGIVLFIKFDADFKVYKESIFQPFTNETLIATKVDVEGRKVFEFNHRPAAQEYARILNMQVSSLNQNFMSHPLGFVGKQLSVGSPMCVNEDQSISFYCQVPKNAEMKILKPIDVLETMDLTVKKVHEDFKKVTGSFAINCILRKIQFQQTKLIPEVNKRLERLGNVFGFCSYGEQLQNEQINQTLVLLTIGERK